MPDLIIRGGTLVTPDGVVPADIAIEDGRIAAIGPELPGAARRDRRARPHRLPGPDRRPPALQRTGPHRMGRRGHRQPRARGRRRHAVLRHAAELHAVHRRSRGLRRQARGAGALLHHRFRACGAAWSPAIAANWRNWPSAASSASRPSCAIPDCPNFRAPTISRCTKACAKPRASGLPVAVHAESEEITVAAHAARVAMPDAHGVRDLPGLAAGDRRSRGHPARRAAGAARPARKLHIVHVSSGRGVAAALEARARGADVSIETCAALPLLHRGRPGAARRRGQVRAAAARRRASARRSGGTCCARRRRHRGLGPFARAADR